MALYAQVVRQFASGKIRIATSDQEQVAVQPSIAVERAGGFDGRAELIIGTNQRERRRNREELGVRSWSEEFVGIEGVQSFACGERCDLNAPEPARQVGCGEHACNSFLKRFGRSRQR